jgi:2-polyprenyl-3-methyl-5-hydroxy-6-metoxy-1,4-benzoquinol methylase
MKEIIKCQNEITSFPDKNAYYIDGYRDTEIFYWMNIPEWILELKSHHVKNCLDIGGAYGTLAIYCKNIFNCNVFIIDLLDTYFSKLLLKKYDISYAANNIELDPFPWNVKFDVIILTEVLEHFNFHPIPTLKKINSLLSDDGCIFLSTPDSVEWGVTTKYFNSLEEIPLPVKDSTEAIDDHHWHYNKNELLYVLDEAGFYVEKFAYSKGVMARHFNLMLRKKPKFETMEQLQAELNTKSEISNYLKNTLVDRSEKLTLLKKELDANSITVGQLKKELATTSNVIDQLKNELKNENDKITRLNHESDLLHQELNLFRHELDVIKTSRSYRLAQIYGKKLAGTAGGKLFEKILDYIVEKNNKPK